MAKTSHLGKETALASIDDGILSKLDQQNSKKETAKVCQDKVGQSFKIPCFIKKKILSYILGLWAGVRCPNVTEEPWVIFQTANCFSQFYSFESGTLHFLLTQVILCPSGIFDRVED